MTPIYLLYVHTLPECNWDRDRLRRIEGFLGPEEYFIPIDPSRWVCATPRPWSAVRALLEEELLDGATITIRERSVE